jgi:hypothetical protein
MKLWKRYPQQLDSERCKNQVRTELLKVVETHHLEADQAMDLQICELVDGGRVKLHAVEQLECLLRQNVLDDHHMERQEQHRIAGSQVRGKTEDVAA